MESVSNFLKRKAQGETQREDPVLDFLRKKAGTDDTSGAYTPGIGKSGRPGVVLTPQPSEEPGRHRPNANQWTRDEAAAAAAEVQANDEAAAEERFGGMTTDELLSYVPTDGRDRNLYNTFMRGRLSAAESLNRQSKQAKSAAASAGNDAEAYREFLGMPGASDEEIFGLAQAIRENNAQARSLEPQRWLEYAEGLQQSQQQKQALAAQGVALENRAAAANAQGQVWEYSNLIGGYGELINSSDFAKKSQYTPTDQSLSDITKRNVYDSQLTYRAINGDREAQDYILRRDSTTSGFSPIPGDSQLGYRGGKNDYLFKLTDTEKSVYNALYASSPKAASDFVEKLKPYLEARARDSAQTWASFMAQRFPALTSIATIPAGVEQSREYLTQIGDLISNGKINQNSADYRASQMSNTVRGEVAKMAETKWGEVGSAAYNLGMSMGDFLFSTAAGGGMKALNLGLMGTRAAASTVLNLKDRGLDDTAAFTLGSIAGAAEIITESFSLEKLLNPNLVADGIAKNILKNFLAEASEEGASDLINWAAEYIYDAITGNNAAEWKQKVYDAIQNGADPNDAVLAAIQDNLVQLGTDMLSGGISGGLMSAAGTPFYLSNFNNSQQGQYANAIRGNEEDLQALIQRGLESPQNTESYQLAQAALKQFADGKTPSALTIARLVEANQQQIDNETAEQSGQGRLRLTLPRTAPTQSAPQATPAVTAEQIDAFSGTPALLDTIVDKARAGQQLTADDALAVIRDPYAAQALRESGAFTREAYNALASGEDSVAVHLQALRAYVAKQLEAPTTASGAETNTAQEPAPVPQETREAPRLTLPTRATQAPQEQNPATPRLTLPTVRDAMTRAAQAENDLVTRLRASKPGLLVDDYATSNIDETQRKAIDETAKRLGLRVAFSDTVSLGTDNAKIYDDGVVLIEKNNPNPIGFLYGHEMGHWLQQNSPEAYNEFAEAARATDPEWFKAREEATASTYRNAGIEISPERLQEEVLSDYAGWLVQDADVLNRFINQNKDKPNVLRRLYEAIKALAAKLTGRERQQATTAADLLLRAMNATESNVQNGIMSTRETRSSFGGLKAQYADAEAQARAEQLLGNKQSEAKNNWVRKKTGWFKGSDGKWRFEIDDSGARVTVDESMKLLSNKQYEELATLQYRDHNVEDMLLTYEEERLRELYYNWLVNQNMPGPSEAAQKIASGHGTVGDILDHEELFRQYPFIANIPLGFKDLGKTTMGQVQYGVITLNTSLLADEKELRNTLLHEIQHMIQKEEGFAKGTNPRYWQREIDRGMDATRPSDVSAMNTLARLKEEHPDMVKDVQKLDQMFNENHDNFTLSRDNYEDWINKETGEVFTASEVWGEYDKLKHEMEAKYGRLLDEYYDATAHFGSPEDAEQAIANGPSHRTAFDLYQDTYGEAEARNVEARASMTPEMRRTIPPFSGDEDTVFVEPGFRNRAKSSMKGLGAGNAPGGIAADGFPSDMQTFDDDYMAAVSNNDVKTQNDMIRAIAVRNGYDSPLLMHGTDKFGFTSYDRFKSDDHLSFFLTADKRTAGSYIYRNNREIREIREANQHIDFSTLSPEKLLEAAKKASNWFEDYALINDVEKREVLDAAKYTVAAMRTVVEDARLKASTDQDTGELTNEDVWDVFSALLSSLDELLDADSHDEIAAAWDHINSTINDLEILGLDTYLPHLADLDEDQLYFDYDELSHAKNLLDDLTLSEALYRDYGYLSLASPYESAYIRLDTASSLAEALADEQAEHNESGIYQFYANPGKQLVIDCNNSYWNNIDIPQDIRNELHLYGHTKTRDVSKAAHDHGYDSIQFRDIIDNGGATEWDGPSDVYIFFDGSRVKSADPVTVDDNGEIIKPSERFKPANEFRRSLKGLDADIAPESMRKTDEDYMAAVNSGDMETAQRMVDDAAKAAGYTIKAYHGTTDDFTKFSRGEQGRNHDGYLEFGGGFYFTPSENEAREWVRRGRSGLSGKAEPKVMSVYLSPRNIINADEPIPHGAEALQRMGMSKAEANFIAGRTYRFINYLAEDKGFSNTEIQDELKSLGYDAIDATYRGGTSGQYVVFDPEQVKSADPVTYDDAGKPIPLSERFNPDNPDTRYSLKGLNADIAPESIQKYGQIPKGEKPARDINVPRKVTDKEDERVSWTARTALEAKATPDAAIPAIAELVEKGAFSYKVQTDKAAIENAEATIKDKGWSASLADWVKDVTKGNVNKANTAMGWALYNNAANAGDLDTALTVLDLIVKHQRNAAQALQASRILKQLTPEARLYGVQRSVDNLVKELQERYGKRKNIDIKINRDLAQAFLDAKTEEERQKALEALYKDIGRQIPATFLDKWNAWRYLAMLGNPRTHVRNVAGNTGFAPVVLAKDQVATALESIASAVSKGKVERTKGLVLPVRDHDLVKAAWDRYQSVRDEALGEGKYNDSQMANKWIEEGRTIFKFKPLELARRGNSAALDVEDVWFSQPHYTYALAQYCKANGITPAQIRSGEGMDKADAYAIKEAQKATYRDTNAFSSFVSSLGRAADRKSGVGKAASAVLEGVLPFRKTPANILVRGLEYSPVGLLKSLTYDLAQVTRTDADGNPRMSVAEMLDDVSEGLTGTGLLALGALLVKLGLLRGRGEDEKKVRDFYDLMGYQNYALTLPNGKSYTLDWLAPESLPLFVGANIYEKLQQNKGDMKMSDIIDVISQISEPMLEMSMLQSLNDMFESIGYAKENELSGLTQILSSAATSYLTQAIPTLLGQGERTGEKLRMTTYTDKNKWLTKSMQYTLGKISAKIPGWDYDQIPYIDAWGRTEVTGDGWVDRAVKNMVNPAYTDQTRMSDMEAELLRLYNVDPDKYGSVLPTSHKASKYLTHDKERIDLTGEQYVAYATTKGQMAYDLITELTESDAYKNASDDDKAKMVDAAYDYAATVAKGKLLESLGKTYEDYNKLKDRLDKGADIMDMIALTQEIKNADAENNANSSYDTLEILSAFEALNLPEAKAEPLMEQKLSGSQWEKYNTLKDAGVNYDTRLDIMRKYSELNANEDMDSGTRALEFAHYVDGLNLTGKQTQLVKDTYKFWTQVPAEAKRYETTKLAGLSDDKAMHVAEVLGALEPLPGKEDVTDLQRYRAIESDKTLTNSEKIKVIGSIMGTEMKTEKGNPSQWAKFNMVLNNGKSLSQAIDIYENGRLDVFEAWTTSSAKSENVSWEVYDKFKKDTARYDGKENGESVSGLLKARVCGYIDSLNLTIDQKKALLKDYNKDYKDDYTWHNGSYGSAPAFNKTYAPADTGKLRLPPSARMDEQDRELWDMESHGGNVNLRTRKTIPVTNDNIDTVKGWGMDSRVGDYMTVASQTYRDGDRAVVVTPILPDGSLMTQAELDTYMDSLRGSNNYADADERGIILGVFDSGTWQQNLEDSDAFAERVHELHEKREEKRKTSGLKLPSTPEHREPISSGLRLQSAPAARPSGGLRLK